MWVLLTLSTFWLICSLYLSCLRSSFTPSVGISFVIRLTWFYFLFAILERLFLFFIIIGWPLRFNLLYLVLYRIKAILVHLHGKLLFLILLYLSILSPFLIDFIFLIVHWCFLDYFVFKNRVLLLFLVHCFILWIQVWVTQRLSINKFWIWNDTSHVYCRARLIKLTLQIIHLFRFEIIIIYRLFAEMILDFIIKPYFTLFLCPYFHLNFKLLIIRCISLNLLHLLLLLLLILLLLLW